MDDFSQLSTNNPIDILKSWWKEAKECKQMGESANAMVFSTLSSSFIIISHHVTSRVVLLKDIQNDHLLFYTNYKSPKAQAVSMYRFLSYPTSHALNFYWPILAKQIRLEGFIKKTSQQQSDNYWKTRPRKSQVSQYISKQSQLLKSHKILKQQWEQINTQFIGKPIPRPSHWGGIHFIPTKIEFWKEQPNRLHKRLVFIKKGLFKKHWKTHWLYP